MYSGAIIIMYGHQGNFDGLRIENLAYRHRVESDNKRAIGNLVYMMYQDCVMINCNGMYGVDAR